MSAVPEIETASATTASARTTNVMIVGVGGQGVLMISKALALIGQKQGLQVKQSEVHGMAKRGGVVFSHVRFGAEVWSPTICKGEADVLIALEWAEGLRWLEYLRPDTGVFIADTRRIVPPFACRSRRRGATMAYARETPAEVIDKVSEGYALDAAAIATGLGEPRAANTVLLGVLSASMGVPVAEWLAVLEMLVPPKSRAINHKAFEAGRAWAEAAHDDASLRFDAGITGDVMHADLAEVSVRLDINAAWCKGCDICVKLCPERCLALDDHQVAYLKAPQACTGCHVCEWLCPDFAIEVHTTQKVSMTVSE
jgi:indolepyruvate ferredoxin oxidoreductase beta subunit